MDRQAKLTKDTANGKEFCSKNMSSPVYPTETVALRSDLSKENNVQVCLFETLVLSLVSQQTFSLNITVPLRNQGSSYPAYCG